MRTRESGQTSRPLGFCDKKSPGRLLAQRLTDVECDSKALRDRFWPVPFYPVTKAARLSPSLAGTTFRTEERLRPAPLNCPPQMLPSRLVSRILLETLSTTIRGAGGLLWFPIFVETRSKTEQTRREPLFSSIETPARALTARR